MKGQLRVYLGAAPGVGKTYAMLTEGMRRASRGTTVAVGYVEERHHAKLTRVRRRMGRWLLVGAMIVLSLCLLISLAMAMLTLMQPTFTGV